MQRERGQEMVSGWGGYRILLEGVKIWKCGRRNSLGRPGGMLPWKILKSGMLAMPPSGFLGYIFRQYKRDAEIKGNKLCELYSLLQMMEQHGARLPWNVSSDRSLEAPDVKYPGWVTCGGQRQTQMNGRRQWWVPHHDIFNINVIQDTATPQKRILFNTQLW